MAVYRKRPYNPNHKFNMEMNEIIENNKLIAEFMGLKLGIDKYCWHPGSFVPLQEEHLAYHAEWGWIMQVIEKIESFHLYVHIETHGCNINSRGCEDEKYPWLEKFWNVEMDEIIQEDESKIIATWKCCVKFIKWYNENK